MSLLEAFFPQWSWLDLVFWDLPLHCLPGCLLSYGNLCLRSVLKETCIVLNFQAVLFVFISPWALRFYGWRCELDLPLLDAHQVLEGPVSDHQFSPWGGGPGQA